MYLKNFFKKVGGISFSRSGPRPKIPTIISGFHSCVGGCNGCINLNEVDNKGFEEFSFGLEDIYQRLNLEKKEISRADFWALTAIVATENAINKHGGWVDKVAQFAVAKAPWFRLRLPSCDRGFKSQAHHLRFFNLYYWNCNEKRTKINKRGRSGLAHFFKKVATSISFLNMGRTWPLFYLFFSFYQHNSTMEKA